MGEGEREKKNYLTSYVCSKTPSIIVALIITLSHSLFCDTLAQVRYGQIANSRELVSPLRQMETDHSWHIYIILSDDGDTYHRERDLRGPIPGTPGALGAWQPGLNLIWWRVG